VELDTPPDRQECVKTAIRGNKSSCAQMVKLKKKSLDEAWSLQGNPKCSDKPRPCPVVVVLCTNDNKPGGWLTAAPPSTTSASAQLPFAIAHLPLSTLLHIGHIAKQL
jgi:hypothetical protein